MSCLTNTRVVNRTQWRNLSAAATEAAWGPGSWRLSEGPMEAPRVAHLILLSK